MRRPAESEAAITTFGTAEKTRFHETLEKLGKEIARQFRTDHEGIEHEQTLGRSAGEFAHAANRVFGGFGEEHNATTSCFWTCGNCHTRAPKWTARSE